MSDFGRLLVAFFAVVNPAAVLLAVRAVRRDRSAATAATVAAACVIAVACVALAAATSERLLDGLEIAPESFRVAAGIVIATTGVYACWRGRLAHAPGEGSWRDAIFPLALPILFGPAMLVAAISYGADEGTGRTVTAATAWIVVAALLAVVAERVRPAVPDALARLTGALLIVVAVGLVVDGIRAI